MTTAVGTKVVRLRIAVSGVAKIGAAAVGANAVSARAAVPGVSTTGVETVGAKAVSVRLAVVGVTSTGVLTVGAKVARVRPAVVGVAVTGPSTTVSGAPILPSATKEIAEPITSPSLMPDTRTVGEKFAVVSAAAGGVTTW